MSESKKRKYLSLTILAFGGAMIYTLPYLRWVLWTPLRQALALTETQFGFTMSVFGIFATLTYWPGGWLADRISPRKLLTFSYVTTGLMGFWLSTFPSYWASVVIHGVWGVSTSLTFWAAMIRATKDLAASDEQGRFFGLLESGRGFFSMVVNYAVVWFFGVFAAPATGMHWVIIVLSIGALSAGLVTWTTFKDPAELTPNPSILKDMGETLKSPMVWALSLIIFTAYVARCLVGYMTPYLTEVMLVSAATTGLLATSWNYIGQFAGGPSGGLIADKIKSRALVVSIGFAIMVALFLIIYFIPGQPEFKAAIMGLVMLLFITLYAVRGVYFALLDDMGVPPQICGAAIGLASLIGFTPEVFVYTWAGSVIDKYKAVDQLADGYGVLFLAGAGAELVGLITALVVLVKIRTAKRALVPAAA